MNTPQPLIEPPPAQSSSDGTARAAVERIQRRNPKADPQGLLPDVHPARIPRHVAIIMDGNGRWAAQRGFHRMVGHRNGATAVREVITECLKLGVEYLTLYSFSLENWKRPAEEVAALMQLYQDYMHGERAEFMRENIRLRQIGRREGLPAEALALRDAMQDATAANSAMTVVLAVNYGSRMEITEAVQRIARDAAAGRLDPEAITPEMIGAQLDTAGIPDPDLLIRTAGEMRVSNFLLWQISYAEIFVTPTLWPDFDRRSLHEAVRAYAARERRFGGLDVPSPV